MVIEYPSWEWDNFRENGSIFFDCDIERNFLKWEPLRGLLLSYDHQNYFLFPIKVFFQGGYIQNYLLSYQRLIQFEELVKLVSLCLFGMWNVVGDQNKWNIILIQCVEGFWGAIDFFMR